MKRDNILTAMDIGTTKVCTIVARLYAPNQAEILGVGVAPSQGLRKGTVVDVQQTQEAVRASVEEVAKEAGFKIGSAYVGVTGSHIESVNQWSPVEPVGRGAAITSRDLERVRQSVYQIKVVPERQVLHAIPRSYAVDGLRGLRNPVGMHTQHLEVQTHTVTGNASLIDNLVRAVGNAGMSIQGLVLEPLASGEAVLTPEEREHGVILVDIGGGTSDIAVFQEGVVFHTAVIPVGGYQFTNDIAMTFDTPFAAAETAKLEHGNTNPETVDPRDQIELPVFGQEIRVKVPRREMCQLMRERAQELFQLVAAKVDQVELKALPEPRLVLTGGSANIPGLEEVARRTLRYSVRTGVPRGPLGMPERLENPAYATSVGILVWCMNDRSEGLVHGNGRHGLTGLYQRFRAWLLGRVRG